MRRYQVSFAREVERFRAKPHVLGSTLVLTSGLAGPFKSLFSYGEHAKEELQEGAAAAAGSGGRRSRV
jgi:hypothetical protein